MTIKLVGPFDNILKMPKKKWTMHEVLQEFSDRLPKEDETLPEIVNATIIYETSDGFAHAVLHDGHIIHLIGALESAKGYLLGAVLSNGEMIYEDEEDD